MLSDSPSISGRLTIAGPVMYISVQCKYYRDYYTVKYNTNTHKQNKSHHAHSTQQGRQLHTGHTIQLSHMQGLHLVDCKHHRFEDGVVV